MRPDALPAQQPPPPAPVQEPTFRSGIDLVAVDVQIVDREGRPLVGLTPADFQVWINGKERRVASADLVQYSAPIETTLPGVRIRPLFTPGQIPTDSRVFILAVDTASFNAQGLKPAIQAAQRFLDRLRPEDMVGLYVYPFAAPRLDLTHSHAAVSHALGQLVAQFEPFPGEFAISPSEVIELSANDPDTFQRVVARECEGSDGLGLQACRDRIRMEASAHASYLEGRAAQSVGALRQLFRGLGSLPGRKTVLLVSGGLIGSARVGGRPDLGGITLALGQDAAASTTNLYVLFMDNSFLDTYSATVRVARNASGRFQSQLEDTGALLTGLDRVAGEAGGRLIRVEAGTSDFAFTRVLRETMAYYLLGVEPIDADRDGKTHFIRVKVNAPRASVMARQAVLIPRK